MNPVRAVGMTPEGQEGRGVLIKGEEKVCLWVDFKGLSWIAGTQGRKRKKGKPIKKRTENAQIDPNNRTSGALSQRDSSSC